jgi:hypothetical protein
MTCEYQAEEMQQSQYEDYGNEYTEGLDERNMLPFVDDLPQTVLNQSASKNICC